MADEEENTADLAYLEIPQVGSLKETTDPWEPFQLVDPDSVVVGAVSEYLKDLQAAGRSVATQRSYGMDLLRWFRFLWAVEVPWQQATRREGREFARWLQIADKHRGAGLAAPAGTGLQPSTWVACRPTSRRPPGSSRRSSP
jgi:hypothetical protein